MKLLLFVLLLVGLSVSAFAETEGAEISLKISVPKGWRVPSDKELLNDLKWRSESRDKYLSVEHDFDGDGKIDRAGLFVNDKKNSIGLFATLSSNKFIPILVHESPDKKLVSVMGIDSVKSGMYQTACGKGLFACAKDEEVAVKIDFSAINYFKQESASSFFIWDKNSGKFERVWISD